MAIPTYGGQRVRPSPIGGERLNTRAPGIDLSSFNAAGSLADLGSQIAQDAENRRKREYMAKLAKHEVDLKNQLSQVRGKDALEASTAALAAFDEIHSEEMKKLKGPREGYDRIYDDYKHSLRSYAEPYAAGQARQYDGEVIENMSDNEERAAIQAWNDPVRVQTALKRIAGGMSDFARDNGKPPEWVNSQYGARANRIHQSVFNRMVAAGRTEDAKAYLERNGKAFVDQPAALKSLETASVRADAQRIVSDTFNVYDSKTGPPTGLGDAKSRAGVLMGDDASPELKDEVNSRIEHDWAIRERAEKARYAELLDEANKHVVVGDDIPPAMWNELKGVDQRMFRKLQEHAAKGTPIVTDWRLQDELKRKLADPKNGGDFARDLDLMAYRDRLSDASFLDIQSDRDAVLKGDQKRLTEMTSGRTIQDKISSKVRILGLEKYPMVEMESRNRENQPLRLAYEEEQERQIWANIRTAREAAKDKFIPEDRIDSIIDGAVWGEVEQLKDDVSKIPSEDRKAIERAYRIRGIIPSDKAIMELYNIKFRLRNQPSIPPPLPTGGGTAK